MKRAVVGICSNLFVGMQRRDMRSCELGVSIVSLAPTPEGSLICRVNGEWLLRESWTSTTRAGDVIEFYDLPRDKELVRSVLQIAAIVASFVAPQFAVYFYAANAAYNLLVPPSQPKAPPRPGETGDVFSSSLTGNQARLDQPIWRICGRREINPPFAAQPYFEFLPKVGVSDVNLDNEQYFYALLAIGVGDYDVVAKIGNTPLSRFADIVTAQYLAPGVAPSTVAANVTTADEVSSQVLDSGRYVGGFAACAPQRTCASIGIDVVATRGLGKTAALTVEWRVEYRPINDFGQAIGSWSVIGTESRTAFTSTPQRWSARYTLPGAARVEVRLVRTDIKDEDPQALHEIAWTGLRAYLAEPAPLNEHTAHFEIVLRASSQLSQNAARDVRLITYGKARTLNADLTWNAPTTTRNWVWWLLDLITSATWGIARPDDRIDMQSFYDLAIDADVRQDRFDYTFDATVNAWDAMQLIARAGRSRVFRRNGVISIARDALADLSVTAFTPRNCESKMQVSEKLRTSRTPDGVVVEYQDHRTWEWTPIECPLPGVVEMADPVRIRLDGVTGETHAHREGLYEAANLLYRPRIVEFKTEMQGMLPAYLSPVDFIADVEGYGHSGDVAFWDEDMLTATLTEPADFSGGSLFLTLLRDDGSLTSAIEVTPGTTAYEVVLPEAPDFNLVLDDGKRERPKYLLGVRDVVRVLSITDGGRTDVGTQLFGIAGVIDDDRVHAADVLLLPGPGDVQDPVGDPDDDPSDSGGGGGGGTLVLPRLTDHTFFSEHLAGIGSISADVTSEFTLRNDGSFTWAMVTGSGTDTSGSIAHEWAPFGTIDVSDAALFDVRATEAAREDPSGNGVFTGTAASWLSLAADHSWKIESPFFSDLVSRRVSWTLFVEIRHAASGVVQASATITLICDFESSGGS